VGQQAIFSAFRSGPVDPLLGMVWNAADSQTNGVWTPGATLIDNVPIQQPLMAAWAIVAYTVRASILYDANGAPFYGKLGSVVAGLVHAAPTIGSPTQPWVNPAQPVPPSPAGFATLWSNDMPAPPNYPGPTIPVTVDATLPVPLKVWPGDSVQIGIWIQPSLAVNVCLIVVNASYRIVYDDGAPGPGSGALNV
jgi:hypothetical protein